MRAFIAQLRVAMIDMRGDLKRFTILLACLALGVGTIAMVGAVGAALQAALDRDARLVLGGDLEVNLTYRDGTDQEAALFDELGTVSHVIETAGRGRFGEQGAFLVLRGVSDTYPLVGAVRLGGTDRSLPELIAKQPSGAWGIVIDDLFLKRTGAKIGDHLMVGDAEFEITGLREGVPDQVTQGVEMFGIPALVSIEGLYATGVLEPGSVARYRFKIVLDEGVSVADATARINALSPDAGWQIRTPRDATDDLAQFFDLFQRFLTIVGLSALLVGGVGVSNAVSAYVTDRQRSIATMRSIGATSSRILMHFLTQVVALTLTGIAIGLILGALLTLVALPILGGMLGIALDPTVDWKSLGSATAFGLLIGFAFGYLPLHRAQAMRPALLFRSVGAAVDGLHWRDYLKPRVWLPIGVAMALALALAVAVTQRPFLVLWYTLGVIVAFVVLRGAGWLMQRGLKVVPPLPSANLRNAIKSIYRPGAPAPTVILSLGLGLSLLLLIALVDANLRNQLEGESLKDAPTFLFFDLFDDEADALKTLSASDPRIEKFIATPMVRGDFLNANGKTLEELEQPPSEIRAMLEGDVPLSYGTEIPEGNTILSGEWWPPDYSGPPLVSVYDALRVYFGLKIGDQITFRVFGEEVTATIANFRTFELEGGDISFIVVYSPGALDMFPISNLGLMKTVSGQEDSVQQTLVDDYPSLVFLPLGDAIAAIGGVVNTVTNAVAIVGGLALVSGLLVLAGAMAAGRRQREADAVVAKVLGATRADVIRAYLVEYGLLGALSAVIAVILGVAGAWGFVTQILDIDFVANPVLLVSVVVAAVILTIAVGAATTWSALSVRPAPFLRIE